MDALAALQAWSTESGSSVVPAPAPVDEPTPAAPEPPPASAAEAPPPSDAPPEVGADEGAPAADQAGSSAPPEPAREKKRSSSSSKESKTDYKARVVKEVKDALNGFYSAGRITSKEDFKELCRDLSHRVMQKEPKRTTWDDKMPAKIRKYVDGIFSKEFIYDPSKAKKQKS